VETGTAETIEVIGEFVEPVQLQVVYQNLWQGLPPNATQITEEHLATFGSLDHPLANFYETAIHAAATQARTSERELRQWCEQRLIITPPGIRGIVHRGATSTEGISNKALDILEDKHLIRSEWRAGSRWYELTHDRIVAPILASNKRWREQEALKTRKRIMAIAGLVLAVLLVSGVCATLLITVQTESLVTSRAQALVTAHTQASATAQARATAQATAQVQENANALFDQTTSQRPPALDDPLSADSSIGWEVGSQPGGSCAFVGGAYHIAITRQNYFYPCLAQSTNFSNFAFQAQMTIIKGDGGGLIFRNTTNASYIFRVGIDGTSDLISTTGRGTILLFSGSSLAIHKGANQPNELTVIAIGDAIFLYVNGQYLGSVTDNISLSGQIGLFAVDFGNPTDVAFKDAKAWTL
jgi:hypothetical protein